MDIDFLVMFYIAISMNLKLKEENQVVLPIGNLMDDDLVIINELSLLAYKIKKEVINVLDLFLSF